MADGVRRDRLRRFLHLERPRAPGGAAPPQANGSDMARASLLEGPGPAMRERPPPTSPARFRPAPEPPLQLEDRLEGEQPFVRCAACSADNSRYAVRCERCGAPLDTPEQRAFNAVLWQERRAESVREAQEIARREADRSKDEELAQRARRALGEELAREIDERERRRLGPDGLREQLARLVRQLLSRRGERPP